MVKVGVPAWVGDELLTKFPREAEIVRIEAQPGRRTEAKPERTIEVEFWIAPAYPKEAAQVASRLSGLRVAQSLLAGVDWLQPLIPPQVTLCDAQGVHNIPTAEWAVAQRSGRAIPRHASNQAEILSAGASGGAVRKARDDRGVRSHWACDRG